MPLATNQLPAHAPPIWQLDQEILTFTAEFLWGIHPNPKKIRKLTPETRPVQDLGIDSLDWLDYLFQLEKKYNLHISDATSKRFFTTNPFTLHTIAQIVFDRWGIPPPPRIPLLRNYSAPPPSRETPIFSQLGGTPSPGESALPLFTSLGSPKGTDLFQRSTDGMRVAHIPAATARLGSDASIDEAPAHHAELFDYLIDAEPVSTTAFARFLNALGDIPESTRLEWCDVTDHRKDFFQLERAAGHWQPITGTAHHPMILVSWFGANAYALWANRRDWRTYRGTTDIPPELRDRSIALAPAGKETLGSLLPSEAQWEHAATGEKSGQFQPWAQAHVQGATYTVATMPMQNVSAPHGPSRFGLAHMPGNVWQWCRDFFTPDFYRTPNSRRPNPQGTTPSPVRSERGGSWVGPASLATASYRRARPPIARGRCLGFRCISLPTDLPISH